MKNLLQNKMIQTLMDKAPDNVKEMLKEVLSDDELSLQEKISKLQASIEGNKNYDKAKKVSGFFNKKWFGNKEDEK